MIAKLSATVKNHFQRLLGKPESVDRFLFFSFFFFSFFLFFFILNNEEIFRRFTFERLRILLIFHIFYRMLYLILITARRYRYLVPLLKRHFLSKRILKCPSTEREREREKRGRALPNHVFSTKFPCVIT